VLTRAVRSSALGPRPLGETDRIGATLHSGARGLANATNKIRAALQSLAEETEDRGCHVSTVAGEFV